MHVAKEDFSHLPLGIAHAGNSAAESAEELSYGKRAAHQAVVFLQQLRRNFAGGMPYFFRNTRVK